MNKYKLRTVLLSVLALLILSAAFTASAYCAFKNIISSETERMEDGLSGLCAAEEGRLQDSLDRLTDEARASAALVALTGADSEQLYRCFDLSLESSRADAALLFSGDGLLKYGALEYRDVFAPCAMTALTSGVPVLSDALPCADGSYRFAVSYPFKDGSGTLCAVTLLYPDTLLSELSVSPALGNIATLRLLRADGSAISPKTGSSPWLLQSVGDAPTLSAISGTLTPCADEAGQDVLLFSSPAGINSWYFACSVPMSYIYACAQDSFKASSAFILTTFVALCVMLLVGILLQLSRRRRLRLERQRFDFAANQSSRAVFEYRRDTDRLRLISRCADICLPGSSRRVPLSQMINLLAPEDRGELSSALHLLSEEGYAEATLRMTGLRGAEGYHWYHITAKELGGASGAIVIGTIEDIDERERERIDLLHKAITDPLTGLFNRAETERMVNERLAALDAEQSGTFCIIDMDNFKHINDTQGHECGDRALRFFARQLRAAFRFGDIVGRLGGDEFVVYMGLTSDRRVVSRRIDELMRSLSVRESAADADLPELSCSIGCVAAQTGDDFALVYNLADKALYRAKTSGKRRAEFEETA